MSNKVIILFIGIVTGALISAWYLRSAETEPADMPLSDARAEAVETRLAALESTMAEQIESISGEIESLRSDFVSLSASRSEAVASSAQLAGGTAVGGSPGVGGNVSEIDRMRQILATPGGRIGALTEAGFTRASAERIERRIEEHRVAAIQARYDSARRGESSPVGNSEIDERFDVDSMLRSELGDADYERYLTALGRPTEVLVLDVLSSSAAEQAGMLAGDRIVSYDAQRVFNIRELMELPIQGEPGVPVVVDIVRDGQRMQLVVPRGPIGIMAPTGFPAPVESTGQR